MAKIEINISADLGPLTRALAAAKRSIDKQSQRRATAVQKTSEFDQAEADRVWASIKERLDAIEMDDTMCIVERSRRYAEAACGMANGIKNNPKFH